MSTTEKDVSEYVYIAETVSLGKDMNKTVSESVTLADTTVEVYIQIEEVDETVTLADTETHDRCLDEDVAEDVTASDDVVLAATVTNQLQGYCRMKNDSLERYEVFVGTDAMPTLTDDPIENPPTYTFTGSSKAISLAAGHTYYICTRHRDANGNVDGNVTTKIITIDGGGEEVIAVPNAPQYSAIKGASGGRINITGIYDASEANPANHWRVYLTSDGSDPDPTDAGDLYKEIDMATTGDIKRLNWTSTDTWGAGTEINVILVSYRSGDQIQSASPGIITYTVVTAGPTLYGGGAVLNEGTDK